MKLILVFAAIVGLSAAAPTRSLQTDLQELVKILKVEEVREIARKYLATDAEFQSVVKYLQGPEWNGLVAEIASKPAVQRFSAYLLEHGIDLKAIIAAIHDIIAGAQVPSKHVNAPRTLRKFLDEIKGLVNEIELIVFFNDKLNNSVEFKDLVEKIKSPEARALVEEIRTIPEVKRLAQRLEEMDVEVYATLQKIYEFLEWH